MIGKFVSAPGNSILGMWQETQLSLETGQAFAPGFAATGLTPATFRLLWQAPDIFVSKFTILRVEVVDAGCGRRGS